MVGTEEAKDNNSTGVNFRLGEPFESPNSQSSNNNNTPALKKWGSLPAILSESPKSSIRPEWLGTSQFELNFVLELQQRAIFPFQIH